MLKVAVLRGKKEKNSSSGQRDHRLTKVFLKAKNASTKIG
jgi:hypothetical protein